MPDKLAQYREKRSRSRTPEPVPDEGARRGGRKAAPGGEPIFVVQEHHARALHWDFRLERDGVLVSWAVPKGLPDGPKSNRLAVQTEDHPLDYADFEGTIPAGEYGGGQVEIWDHGVYECQKWTDREVKVILHGERARGQYVLIHTGEKNWLIHKMDGANASSANASGSNASKSSGTRAGAKRTAETPARERMPTLIRPMMATLGALPSADDDFAYETKWDGVRIVAYLEAGSARLLTRNDIDVTQAYPELHDLGAAAGPVNMVLDGELVAFDARTGRSSFGALQPRMHLRNLAQVARLAEQLPLTYCIFDLLHLDGRPTVALPYHQRRDLLEALDLNGQNWRTPPYRRGGGARALATAKKTGEEGIMAKRLDSIYEPGRRTRDWIKIKNSKAQEVVIGGWQPGKGARAGTIGALLLGIPGDDGLSYAGKVGTGFTQAALDDLRGMLSQIARKSSPFAGEIPAVDARDARWVTPKLVGEVEFAEWTRDGRLRQPRWRGLRPDKSPDEIDADKLP
jgi:bifunctional non-homologous end joining protein LigD